jgi:hypothetical protein
MFRCLPAVALLLLAACATKDAVGGCPKIRDYTAAEEQAITRAMQALPPNSPLLGAMLDYEELRDEVRACGGVASR